MNWQRLLLGLVLALAIIALATMPARAQLFGKRKEPPPPQQRVPELLKILKEDGDERKRLDAVDELRGIDVGKFPEIVPALIEALLNDKKTSVRAEAAYTLGRYRPVQAMVGSALEQARDHDTAMRVRLQARTTLVGYYLAGYRSNRMEDGKQPILPNPPGGPNNKEPPLAPMPGTQPGNPPGMTPSPVPPLQPVPMGQNLPPAPPPVVTELPSKPGYQPLPKGPSPYAPAPTPRDGPDLGTPR
jgi:hypothetical protein